MAKPKAKPAAPTPPPRRPGEQQMFGNLLSSKPAKERGGPLAVFTSSVVHAVLIGFAIWATSQMKQVGADEDTTLSQIITPDDPEPPPPPPPPPPPENEPPPVQAEVVEVPKGFQTLAPPTIVPPDIPPPSTGPVISERDFSGEGVVGGKRDGKVTAVTAENIEAAPTFTPYTVKPEMKNTAEVVRAMQRFYPPLLRDAGIGGKVLVWFLIDEQGEVIRTTLKKGSGHTALDEAALKVSTVAKFSPALNREQRVKVWIELPIEFKTQ
ncbi:MAG: TonB family protein [Gemmatimonadota bacterium]